MRPSAGMILAAVFSFAGLFLCTGCSTFPVAPGPEQSVDLSPESTETDSSPEISEPATPAEELPVVEKQPEFFHHTISFPGETLMTISAWYTNSTLNWKLIQEANPGLNPNLMQLGTVINIPAGLVKNTTPMPKSFLVSKKEAQKPPAAPDASQEESEKIDLFSPDDISPEIEATDTMELFEPPE